MIVQVGSDQSVHPDLQRAMNFVNSPEVQELARKLARYGLAVGLPHMHDDDGKLIPLPIDQVAYEDDLQVSFRRSDDPIVDAAAAVMWRWDENAEMVVSSSHCRGKQHH